MKRIKRVKEWFNNLVKRLKAYFKRLLFPVYLFPIKLITYSFYYIVRFIFKLTLAFAWVIFDIIIYPFRSLKNFIKSIFISVIALYLLASLFVITDYLNKQYGWWGKFLCSVGTRELLKKSVVRVVGGYSEGSGFFISNNEILTNFHVVDGEPSPKIIFSDGKFVTPIKILGDKDADLAVLYTYESFPDLILPLQDRTGFYVDEPLLATGYPFGTGLTGRATILRGNFVDFRKLKNEPTNFIQTNISLVAGMSGGPLTDQCGQVVGINTMGLAGLSLFIYADNARDLIPTFTDQNIQKIEVDPTKSPEDGVKAFYTYLKARKMKEGFDLLAHDYAAKSNFEEWNSRFTDVLDVNIYGTKADKYNKNVVFIKFGTKNWVRSDVEYHYYEGTWETVKEDGKYKLLTPDIKEITEPSWDWQYTI